MQMSRLSPPPKLLEYLLVRKLLSENATDGLNQACRGYEICHPYPYPYPQIFRGYPWISMDISISTDAYRASIATKFSRKTAVPERPFPQTLFL